jgi:hypothetical protein
MGRGSHADHHRQVLVNPFSMIWLATQPYPFSWGEMQAKVDSGFMKM